MADQGASQRRGTESAISTIGQANMLGPNDAGGQYYYSPSGGTLAQHDVPASTIRVREDSISPIGVNSDVTSDHGTSYVNPATIRDAHDVNATNIRARENLYTALGVTTPETPNHGTSYVSNNSSIGTVHTEGSSSPIEIQIITEYKLRAQDSGALPAIQYVYWVSSNPVVGTYTGALPFGGPLTNLTILASWTH